MRTIFFADDDAPAAWSMKAGNATKNPSRRIWKGRVDFIWEGFISPISEVEKASFCG
jgi:hypothetical protein